MTLQQLSRTFEPGIDCGREVDATPVFLCNALSEIANVWSRPHQHRKKILGIYPHSVSRYLNHNNCNNLIIDALRGAFEQKTRVLPQIDVIITIVSFSIHEFTKIGSLLVETKDSRSRAVMCTITTIQWTDCGCPIVDDTRKCQNDSVDPYHCPHGTHWTEPTQRNGHCGCLAQTPSSSSASDGWVFG